MATECGHEEMETGNSNVNLGGIGDDISWKEMLTRNGDKKDEQKWRPATKKGNGREEKLIRNIKENWRGGTAKNSRVEKLGRKMGTRKGKKKWRPETATRKGKEKRRQKWRREIKNGNREESWRRELAIEKSEWKLQLRNVRK